MRAVHTPASDRFEYHPQTAHEVLLAIPDMAAAQLQPLGAGHQTDTAPDRCAEDLKRFLLEHKRSG